MNDKQSVSIKRGSVGYIDHLALIAADCPELDLSAETEPIYYINRMLEEMGGVGRGAFLAVLSNSMKLHKPYRVTSIAQVDWEAILEVLGRMGVVVPSIVSNTLLTLAGKGHINSPTVSAAYQCMSMDENLRVTYEVLMRSIPESVDFSLLSLNLEVGERATVPGDLPFVNRILNMVPWLNRYIVTTIANKGHLHGEGLDGGFILSNRDFAVSDLSEWTEEHVEALEVRIGTRQSLIKTLQILLNSIGRSKEPNPEWERLAKLIEDRLEE